MVVSSRYPEIYVKYLAPGNCGLCYGAPCCQSQCRVRRDCQHQLRRYFHWSIHKYVTKHPLSLYLIELMSFLLYKYQIQWSWIGCLKYRRYFNTLSLACDPGVRYNKKNPSEIHLKIKSIYMRRRWVYVHKSSIISEAFWRSVMMLETVQTF